MDDPDAAGARDAFRAATVAALERALEAHRARPRATAEAHLACLYAAELADRFGLAVAAALEARGELEVAEANAFQAAADFASFAVVDAAASREAAQLAASSRKFADRQVAAAERASELAREYAERSVAARETAREAAKGGDLLQRMSTDADAAGVDTRAREVAEWAALSREFADGRVAFAERAAERALAAADALAAKRAGPDFAELKDRASEFAELAAAHSEDTAAKIETAEDLRRQAMTAYRNAAEAWRAVRLGGRQPW